MSESESLGRMAIGYKIQRRSKMTNDLAIWETRTGVASSEILVSGNRSCCENTDELRRECALR